MNRTVKFMGVRFLRWSCDDWYSENGTVLRSDKIEHVVLGLLGLLGTLLGIAAYYSLKGLGAPDFEVYFKGLCVWEAIAVLWEIKDGVVPYGNIPPNPPSKGGKRIEGFSFKDLLADNYGFLTAILLFVLWMLI